MGFLTAVVLLGLTFIRVGGGRVGPIRPGPEEPPSRSDTAERTAPQGPALDLLFLHHSVGGQLLADPGPDNLASGTHPNGGGLRRALVARGYRVHEATYGSRLGEHTDLFDWSDKFNGHMEEVLAIDNQDTVLEGAAKNRVVMFKSCFPNNEFSGPGIPPGNPRGPELTEANARAALLSLLPAFEKHPDTLFVYLSAPPLAPIAEGERLYKWILKKLLRKRTATEKLAIAGESARRFDAWVTSKDGWLSGYPLKNVAVFDYFGVLTGGSPTGLSKYASEGGTNSHPAAEGNHVTTALLIPFLDAAVERAGLRSRAGAPLSPAPIPSGSP